MAKEVGIIVRSEYWIDAFANQASFEYKSLESKLLSAVSYLKHVKYVSCYRVHVICRTAGQI